jgi:hypothetical protein
MRSSSHKRKSKQEKQLSRFSALDVLKKTTLTPKKMVGLRTGSSQPLTIILL